MEPWVVISEPLERYYFTLKGDRVHTSRACCGLSNARKILSSESPEVFGKTRCKLCLRRE